MNYPVAPDENDRLLALRQLHVLDTSNERPYDALTQIARAHFNVAIVAISLVDEHRQWFKSHPGVDACETHRDVAFCNHTIMSDEIFEVTNAAEHEVFKNNPLVTSAPNIRYYCGAPILVKGHRLGAFCIIDSAPRGPISDVDRNVLQNLAYLTAHIMTSHRTLRESVSSLTSLLA